MYSASHPFDLDRVTKLVQKDTVKDKYQTLICRYLNENIKPDQLPGPQPASMDQGDVDRMVSNVNNYWVTVKMDGLRYMLLVTRADVYLIDRSFNFRKVKEGKWYREVLAANDKGDTLLDGEVVWNKEQMKYMAFDCVMFQGKNLSEASTGDRINAVNQIAQICASDPKKRDETNVPIFAKEMLPLKEIEKFDANMTDAGNLYVYENKEAGVERTLADGLVFMLDNAKYMFYQNKSLLKWKKVDTIDVIADLSTATTMGERVDVKLHYLTKDYTNKIPLDEDHGAECDITTWTKIKEALKPSQPCIVECFFDQRKDRWIIERGRDDKVKPNAFRTVKGTIKLLENKVTRKRLVSQVKATASSS